MRALGRLALTTTWLALSACQRSSPPPPQKVAEGPAKTDSQRVIDNRREDCLDDLSRVPGRYEPIIRALCSEMAHVGGVGAAIAIGTAEGIVFSGGSGERCLGSGEPPDGQTLFRIGSITKILTAQAALALRDDPEIALDLDAPVAELLPALAARDRHAAVTLSELLHHTGGLPELAPHELSTLGPRWLEALAERPAWSEPGELWSYANSGYFVAGAALAAASGQDFTTLVRSRVLERDGLGRVVFDGARAVSERAACGHRRAGDGAWVALDAARDQPHLMAGASWTLPAGGALASVEDLVRLGAALTLRDDLFSGARPTGRRPDESYGWGVRRREYGGDDVLFGHSGNTGTFAVDLLWDGKGNVLALASNTPVHLRGTLDMAARTLFETETAELEARTDPSELVGSFEVAGWDEPIEARLDDGRLRLDVPALALEGLLLRPTAGRRFTAILPGTLTPLEIDFARARADGPLFVRSPLFVGRRAEG